MVLVVRKATEQTALALTSELAAYGERARWSGIYYRGEKIGFSVSQMTERPGGFKLQEDGQMLITLMGDSIASKLHTEVNVARAMSSEVKADMIESAAIQAT